jgi:hypothetical protein
VFIQEKGDWSLRAETAMKQTGEEETPRWRSAFLSSHWSILTAEKIAACFSPT